MKRMIIKSKSYSRNKFRELVEYIFDDRGRMNENNSFTLTQNLISNDKHDIIQEFIEHDDQYRKRRKNGRVLYHEILSFHVQDKEKLNLEILRDLSKKFIKLRGRDALVLAKPHLENDNIHVHLCFSGTEFQSAKTLRLSKEEFRQIRIDLEQYQKEKYPELENSLVYLNAWQRDRYLESEKFKASEQEKQMKKRTGKPSHKDELSKIVQKCFAQSTNKEDFLSRIVQQGISIYSRRGKPTGVLYANKKYRFSTLTLSDKQFELLSKNSKRLNELNRIIEKKQSDKSLNRGLER